MLTFFALFIPAMIGLQLYFHLNPSSKIKDLVFAYFDINIIANVISLFFVTYIYGRPSDDFSLSFTLKYSALSLILSLLCAQMITMVKKDIKLTIRQKPQNKINE